MIANFSAAVTGLNNTQRVLQVTGQNLTNVNTEGYVRRRAELVETFYSNIGESGTGKMQVGSGVDVRCIRQIRNTLLDQAYRDDTSKMSYYKKEYEVYNEVEHLMIDSTDLSGALDDLYGAISTLSLEPSSIAAKMELVVTAQNFVYEGEYIRNQLYEMQLTMNDQLVDEVNEANKLIGEIYELNEQICGYELNEDEASDLRDQRNLALDKLSAIIPITVDEKENHKVQVYTCGRDLFGASSYETITLKPTGGVDGFLTPYWVKGNDPVINMKKPLNEDANFQDGGTLKGLLMSRGNVTATYASSDSDTQLYTIPRIMKDLDTLMHKVVTTINEALAPKSHVDGPLGADKSQYIELFTRKEMDRYSLDSKGNYVYNEEDPNNFESLYTLGNIEVNPILLKQGSYNSLCISPSGEEGDNSLLNEILRGWKDKTMVTKNGTEMNFEGFTVDFLSDIANRAGTSKSNLEHTTTLVEATEAERQDRSGVSLDEELGNLIRYQHSYSASSRVIQTLDSMIETLILNMAV
ncbi:MAG: flagellar hook-associated protein FlgK [Clostridia bacterium]|nr:flagellar hook-associated protein FlgK [Clostridia bacterium]